MSLEEIDREYDWDKYCIVTREGIYENLRDFAEDIARNEHITDDIKFIFSIHEKVKINEILPSVNQLISILQEYLDDYCLDETLRDDTDGVDELASAYENYLKKNSKFWKVGCRVRSFNNEFTTKDFRDFVRRKHDNQRDAT